MPCTLFSLLMLILFASISYYARSCGFEDYFILNQKTSDTPVSLTLEYSVAGKSYAASISTFAKDNAFKEGTHQKYNIAVNGKEIQITGGEIGSWNDGGEMGDINLDVKTGDEENK